MKILIQETGKIKEIVMVAQNGLAYETDFILTNIPQEEWEILDSNDSADIEMSAESFSWWEAHCASYEAAQLALAEKREASSNLVKFEEELDLALQVEFNDLPGAIVFFCESYED